MNNQPIINIGCLGSVSDGKSTLVEKLTDTKTQRHSTEKDRNITIKQGYGNMKIWTDNENNYYTTNSSYDDYNSYNLVNHISFVDCPGHHTLIQTMLASISLMDGAIIIISVDQPLNNKNQLIQHLIAAKLGKLKKLIICLNKIDLVSKNIVLERKKELDEILLKYDIKPYIIIPTCFNKKIGLNYVVKSIMELFNCNSYINRISEKPIFRISRSFDINKPGTDWINMNGGVLGGSLIHGQLKVGDEIEIRPGLINKDKLTWTPLKTKILSIKSENNSLNSIIPGGLIGIGTDIDPYYCKNDLLIGNIVGLTNFMPDVYTEINVKLNNEFKLEETIFHIGELLILQFGTRSCNATIKNIELNNIFCELKKHVCISKNENIIICKYNNDKSIKIITTGHIYN
jgi:translation initiation factor 2 subunit 3